jgi:catalase
MPKATETAPKPEVARSPALSLLARPGEGGIRTRQVAVLVADGCDGDDVAAVVDVLRSAGAVPRLVGPRIGPFTSDGGAALDADASLENHPLFLFDAVVVPGGREAAPRIARDARSLEGLRDQYRHGKAMLALGAGRELLAQAGLPPQEAPGVVMGESADEACLQRFVEALAAHRHFARESDPPRV